MPRRRRKLIRKHRRGEINVSSSDVKDWAIIIAIRANPGKGPVVPSGYHALPNPQPIMAEIGRRGAADISDIYIYAMTYDATGKEIWAELEVIRSQMRSARNKKAIEDFRGYLLNITDNENFGAIRTGRQRKGSGGRGIPSFQLLITPPSSGPLAQMGVL